MFALAERMVAGRYLRPRQGEGFVMVIAVFSLLGIMLGVGTLIVVLAVMNGFRAELLGRILGLNGHATVQAGPQGIVGYADVTTRLRAVDGVLSADPLVQGQVMATANSVASGVLVRGYRPDDLSARASVADNIESGDLRAALDDPDGIVIGAQLARQFGVGLGDTLNLISPQGNATAFGVMPRMRAYRIEAIFNVGMYEYDSSFVFMGLQTAQTYFKFPERASAIEVMVEDPEQIARFTGPLQDAAGPSGRVVDWQQTNRSFFNALQVERNVMFLILTLIILVAAFNIISGLIILVRSKQRDIAILRTMGATRSAIMRIFFLTGASIGVTGTLLGFVLGTAFALNIETIRQALQSLTGTQLFAPEIYFLSQLPAKVESGETAAVVIMGLTLSLLATLYPSWRAARLDPVEALRYE